MTIEQAKAIILAADVSTNTKKAQYLAALHLLAGSFTRQN